MHVWFCVTYFECAPILIELWKSTPKYLKVLTCSIVKLFKSEACPTFFFFLQKLGILLEYNWIHDFPQKDIWLESIVIQWLSIQINKNASELT